MSLSSLAGTDQMKNRTLTMYLGFVWQAEINMPSGSVKEGNPNRGWYTGTLRHRSSFWGNGRCLALHI